MDEAPDNIRREMLKMGIVSYDEQATLWDIAKKCSRTMGVTAAGGGMVLGASVGMVTVPGVGSVPGAVVGLLAGFVTGTAACTAVNVRHRDALRSLLNDQ